METIEIAFLKAFAGARCEYQGQKLAEEIIRKIAEEMKIAEETEVIPPLKERNEYREILARLEVNLERIFFSLPDETVLEMRQLIDKTLKTRDRIRF